MLILCSGVCLGYIDVGADGDSGYGGGGDGGVDDALKVVMVIMVVMVEMMLVMMILVDWRCWVLCSCLEMFMSPLIMNYLTFSNTNCETSQSGVMRF